MIGQILPNNNERCYNNFSPTFREVNTPLHKEYDLLTHFLFFYTPKAPYRQGYKRAGPTTMNSDFGGDPIRNMAEIPSPNTSQKKHLIK
jgi:hypothetical protein